LDRHGKRIDRRNPEGIFIPLYNHQTPPGAASIVHYGLEVPEGLTEPLTFEVKLLYRKFDTRLMRHVYGQDWKNDLPITVLAADRVTFPVAGVAATIENPPRDIAEWERWNDYGIGLLLEGDSGSRKGELRQAEEAFARVEELGRPDGPLNRARVYVKEGRLAEAVVALKKAASHDPPAPPWTVEWFTGLVNKENNHLDDAIQNFTNLIETRYPDAVERGFDFSYDYRVLNELAATLHERSKRERGAAGRELRESFLAQAVRHYSRVLELDPENAPAHYGLSQIYRELGDLENAEKHAKLHRKYKPDDTARRVTALHRAANPAADHAAESIVIYDLQRPGAFGLDPEFGRVPKAASE
ncbi:MAG TPA: tetratricopeptide repeat protein, partial [Planctomycetota bacterium]|nr:tetratricopeptide repeat protein [Planctomycetota bacterium]